MSLYQTTLPPFTIMLISRLIEGASHLAIVVAAPTLIAQASSDRYRGLAMTLWSTFFGVAFALVAWFGIPFTATYGLAGLFLAHAMTLLATAAVLAFWLPHSRDFQRETPRVAMADIVREHIQSYRSPFVSAPAFGWLFYTLTFVSLLTILPDLVPPQDRSLVAGMMPLASIAVSLLCGVVLLPRMTAINVIILGFVLAVCTAPLLSIGVGMSWICIALFGILGLVQGASFAAVPQLNVDANAKARANGAMAQMGNLGNTIGAPVLLSLLAVFGISGLIWGILVCYCAGIGAHWWQSQRRRALSLPRGIGPP